MRLRNVKNKEEILNNSSYFMGTGEEFIGKWSNVFKNNNPIYVEIGMGKGKFIIENFDENQYHFVIDNNGSIEDTYKQVVHIVDEVILNKEKYVKKYDNLNESDASYLDGILNALSNTLGGANDNE